MTCIVLQEVTIGMVSRLRVVECLTGQMASLS